jgi:post-segregation antitoxin (ccd killing protein)
MVDLVVDASAMVDALTGTAAESATRVSLTGAEWSSRTAAVRLASASYASCTRVYSMRMARVNVYLPDDLADAAREAELNVSRITQAALKEALAERDTNRWLDSIARLRPTRATHAQALEAVHAVRDEMGTSDDD